MATVHVEEGSDHAKAIQSAVQQKLSEINWTPDENDTTLSDYIAMMLVEGKNQSMVQAELGGDLLGIGEDDPMLPEFTQWLFDTAQSLAPQQQAAAPMVTDQDTSAAQAQDSQMDDATPSQPGIPSGPKAMRSGVSGRGGRGGRNMRDQINRHMDRPNDHHIKGVAKNSHRGRDAPRGPRSQNLANGIQRAMGRGGADQMNVMSPGMNQGMNPGMNAMGAADPQAQLMMMQQMMEMQANMMQQMFNGQAPGMGRGGPRAPHHKPMFDRMDKRGKNKIDNKANGDGMDVDGSKNPFDVMCKFNDKCANPDCPYAHQTPANTKPGQPVDLTDTCKFGSKCQNFKCAGRHPSPAQAHAGQFAAPYANTFNPNYKEETLCKFYPNCTKGSDCPFIHSDTAKTNIACRYFPCTKPDCPFTHDSGQKVKNNVWTANGSHQNGASADKTDRFAELKENESMAEELIKPENNGEQSAEAQAPPAAAAAMDTEVPT